MYSLHTIENEFLKVSVNPIGAELFSIYDKKGRKEMLWQGNSDFWGSRAPVLFPIVGGLKKNTIQYNGKDYLIPKHGIVRRNDQLELIEEKVHSITYQLKSSERSLKIYPFQFTFTIGFSINKNSLVVKHTVKNEDNTTMYFSLGGHPAFNCPFKKKHDFEDYGLTFEFEEPLISHQLTADGLISAKMVTLTLDKNRLPLQKSLFDKDALIFTSLKSREVSLFHKNNKKKIVVRFNDFPHLGIWSKPGAPFVCIEPWLGYADKWNSNQKIEQKEGMQALAVDKNFEASYSITVE